MATTTTITTKTLHSEKNETQSALVTKVGPDSGPRRLHMIPACSSLEELLDREKRHMAGAFRIFAKLGFADGASGHISLRGTHARYTLSTIILQRR